MANNSTTDTRAFFSIVAIAVAFFICGASELLAQKIIAEKQVAKKSWQDRLPVSMNGKLSDDLPKDFEKRCWHNLRLHRHLQATANGEDFTAKEIESPSPQSLAERALIIAGGKIFDSAKGNELKDAIIEADVDKMKQLIDAGVDVNQKSKQGLTPLHIAMFVDTDPRPFEMLLEHDADPNVFFGEHAGWPFNRFVGLSVSQLSAMANYNRLFKSVFEHGGDPNLELHPFWKNIRRGNPIVTFDQIDSPERLIFLLSKGADFRHPHTILSDQFLEHHLFIAAVTKEDKRRQRLYESALFAVEKGAEFKDGFWELPEGYHYVRPEFSGCYFKPIHFLALMKDADKEFSSVAFEKLIKILGSEGVTLEQATKDLERWRGWKKKGFKKLIQIEYEKRMADASGETLKAWYINELPDAKADLEKAAEARAK